MTTWRSMQHSIARADKDSSWSIRTFGRRPWFGTRWPDKLSSHKSLVIAVGVVKRSSSRRRGHISSHTSDSGSSKRVRP